MKKLLVLAGAGPHVKVVETAKKMGIYTIVADYLPPEQSPAKLIADEHLENNIFDVDELAEYCKTHDVDGVIGFCIDPTQRPVQQIAEKAGLPMFGTKDQVFALTDKTAFKKLCAETGVDTIPSYTEKDVEEGSVDFPVLVKPTDSRGSRGAKICYNYEELRPAIDNAKAISTTHEVLIEKYMDEYHYQDLTISYLVKDGNPILVSLGDRHSGRKEDNLDRQLVCTVQPSCHTQMYLRYVNNRVVNMIKYLGIKNGPVFFQGFTDGNTVRLYDPGLRYPGNEYERLLEKATGINLMQSNISFIVGGEIDDFGGKVEGCYDLNGKTCLQYMINVGPGKIGRFDGLDEISKHPNVLDVQQRHFVGDIIENTGDVRHRAGEISILVDRNVDEMKAMVKFVQDTLVIEDENGRNQIISPFDSSLLDKYGTTK